MGISLTMLMISFATASSNLFRLVHSPTTLGHSCLYSLDHMHWANFVVLILPSNIAAVAQRNTWSVSSIRFSNFFRNAEPNSFKSSGTDTSSCATFNQALESYSKPTKPRKTLLMVTCD